MKDFLKIQQLNNTSVSYAKAIGIILVVIAHAMNSESLIFKTIYAFHMPLFFVLSGYCFKLKYLENFKRFFKRRIIGIYLPFVLFSIPFLFLHNTFVDLNIYSLSLGYYDWKEVLWVLSRITTRMSHNEQLLCVFWFLKELFWGSLIFYGVLKLLKNKKITTTLILLTLTLLIRLFRFRVPYFSITFVSFYAATFISAGCLLKEYENRLVNWWMIALSIFIVAIEVCMWGTSTMNVTVVSLVPYFLSGCAGSIVVLKISKLLSDCCESCLSFLEYVGNHSLSIMALHFVSFKIVSLLIIRLYQLPIGTLAEFPVIEDYNWSSWVMVYSFVGIGLPLVGYWLFDKIRDFVFQR